MCGIVGYVGRTMDDTALNVVMEGLARLEYRGYDSAGVALVTEDGVATEKRSGKLENLRSALEARIGKPIVGRAHENAFASAVTAWPPALRTSMNVSWPSRSTSST